MAWYIPAIASALAWGIYYPLAEYLLKQFSGPFLLAGTHALSSIVLTVLFLPQFSADISTLRGLPKNDIFVLLALSFICIIANCSSMFSISLKNATLTGFLEISYPVFASIFAFIFFRHVQVNIWTMLGGAMIIFGTFIILRKC